MTQNEMPDEIYATPRGSGTISGVYVDMPMGDEERGEHKYHHDRVVTTLEERTARLVEALEQLLKCHDGGSEQWAKEALAENKE